MKKIISLLLIALNFAPASVLGAGRLQDSDFKSLTDVSGNASRLLNTSKIYDVTNSQTLSSSISSGALGGSGGGSKNYLSKITPSLSSGVANTGNGDLELGTTTGFSLGTVALTNNFPSGTPTFGSGASSNLSLSVISSQQLSGKYSLGWSTTAASTAGDLVATSAFFIDSTDQAKVLTYKLNYKVTANPASGNFTGTSANSLGVAIYDVTNSAWIQPSGVFNFTQISGVGQAYGSFQTPSNGSQFRLVVYNANATTGALSVSMDDFSVGPTPNVQVASGFVGQIIPYAGTALPQGYLACDGSAVSRGQYSDLFNAIGTTYGTGDGSTTFNLPNTQGVFLRGAGSQTIGGVGYAATYGSTQNDQMQGHFHSINPSTNIVRQGFANNYNIVAGSNGDLVSPAVGSPTADGTNGTPRTGTETRPANIAVKYAIRYLATTTVSSDTDTRVVAAYAGRITSDQTLASSAVAFKYFTPFYNSIVTDKTGMMVANGTDTYVKIAVPGTYRVKHGGRFAAVSGGDIIQVLIELNGSAVTNAAALTGTVLPGAAVGTAVVNGVSAAAEITRDFVAGDIIRPQLLKYGTTDHTVGQSFSFFSVERLSGPSVIAASESVNARYTSAAGASIPNGGTPTVVNFDTKDYDSHGAVTSGAAWKFTAPVPGIYRVSTNVRYGNGQNWSGGTAVSAQLYKNGAIAWNNDMGMQATIAAWGAGPTSAFSGTVRLLAGEYFDIRTAHGEASARALVAAGTLVWVTVERVGN